MTPAPVASLSPALHDLPPAPLWVGLSGGLDSSVLLHALVDATTTVPVCALHVHHGLHADADRWAEHCTRLCAALGVALTVVHARVSGDAGDGPEAAARAARYAAFHAHVGVGEVLALAHHRDDQAETFLLRALRASGPDGLASMRRWRPMGAARLWRPLLDTPRTALLAYARAHGLAWIEDPSNTDASFDRNFLRERVLPLLRERWPHADAAFARSARLCGDSAALLAGEDAAALAQAATLDPSVLDVGGLQALPPARRARVLRHWIAGRGLPALPAQGIEQFEGALLPARPDAETRFEWRGAGLSRWRGLLHAGWLLPSLPAGWRHVWDGRAPLSLPDGGALQLLGDFELEAGCHVHARAGGERITLPGRQHSHALKHVLQDLGVPPWQRAQLPLLSTAQGELLAVGDLAYSARFDHCLREQGARLHWTPPTAAQRRH